MPKTAHPGITRFTRPGEGVLVDVQFPPNTSITGAGVITFTANLSGVEVPSRRYSADTCFLDYSNGMFSLLFAQQKFKTEDLRSLLIIKLAASAIQQFLNMLTSTPQPNILTLLTTKRGQIKSLPILKDEPKETVALKANIIIAAINGHEACLDFYYVSPFSKTEAAKTKKLALDPVVRIDLQTSNFLSVISELTEKMAQVPDSEKSEL